jgi:fatty acid desaturase
VLAMVVARKERKIAWYRTPVPKEVLASLNQKSDLMGWLQTLGYLGLLLLSGAAAWYASIHLPWFVFIPLMLLHGTFWAFLLNAFHEFCHKSVFKTKSLNAIFLQLISFLSWNNPVLFWTSHQEHHKYTLHPPDDLEVVLPVKLPLSAFLKSAVIQPWDFYARLKGHVRLSLGRLEGEWENAIFPSTAVEQRRSLFRWSRGMLLAHVILAAVAISLGLWQFVVLVTLAPFYGGWLQWLCNNTQHTGLQNNVPDFRLSTRTILLNPFVRFLYWHMNYHIEHHTYAAVPCYNLGRLHTQIKADLPHCPVGLVEAWQVIIPILQKQKLDPSYQFIAELPSSQS